MQYLRYFCLSSTVFNLKVDFRYSAVIRTWSVITVESVKDLQEFQWFSIHEAGGIAYMMGGG